MSKYANCHIKELSVKATRLPKGRIVKPHIDVTFYPRYTVVPKEGAPCKTECMACTYLCSSDDEGEDYD